MVSRIDYLTPRSGVRFAEHGVFDYNLVVKSIQDWYNSRRYIHMYKEDTVKDKDRGKELIIKLTGEREVDDDVKYYVNVEMFITDMQDIKVRDKTVQNGILELKLFAYMEYDYKKKWKGYIKDILFHIHKVYMIKDKIKRYYLENLGEEVFELRTAIKTALDFYK